MYLRTPQCERAFFFAGFTESDSTTWWTNLKNAVSTALDYSSICCLGCHTINSILVMKRNVDVIIKK